MTNEQLYTAVTREPKQLNKNGADLSVTYGQIPFLRDPIKRRRRKGRRFNSEMKGAVLPSLPGSADEE